MGRKVVAPPLGLATIAAATSADVDVRIVDQDLEEVPFDEDFDLVGITCMTSTALTAYDIADRFRESGHLVVMGGSHVSFEVKEALEHSDSVVQGEGELVWPQVVDDAGSGNLKPLYRSEGFPDLRNAPLPRWDLLTHSAYAYHQVQATRGCPHGCSFCCIHEMFGDRVRHRPIDSMVSELNVLSGFETKPVFFCDDNLLVKRSYARELIAAITPLNLRWQCQASLDMACDEDFLDRLARSGCHSVFIGFERLDSNAINWAGKNINKSISYQDAVERIQSRGIGVIASFIVGLQGDSQKTYDGISRFMEDVRPIGVMTNIYTPLPGTRAGRDTHQKGRIVTYDWSCYDARHAVSDPVTMTPKETEVAFDQLNRELFDWSAMATRFETFLEHQSRSAIHGERSKNANRKKKTIRRVLAIVSRLLLELVSTRDPGEAVFMGRMLWLAVRGRTSLGRAMAMIVQGIDWHGYSQGLSDRPAPKQKRIRERAVA